MTPGYLYFAQRFDGGPIKIGYSANPRSRVAALSCGSSAPLDLVAQYPCSPKMEAEIHGVFASGRLHGEWFRDDTPGLDVLIESLIVPDLSDPTQRAMADAVALAEFAEREKA